MSPSPPPPSTPSLAVLRARLPQLMLRDEQRLCGRLSTAHKSKDPVRSLAQFAEELAAAEVRVANRRAAVPELRYPEQLPVSQRREDIAAAIRDNQVVIVAGETGSGKTT